MVRIAFCDDDLAALNTLSVLLDRYRAERDWEIVCGAYQSPLELIAGIERGLCWDILLLDIVMPGENGMTLAKEIRSYDDQVKLIFLTSSPEYAVQSYSVGAYFYLLKPIQAESLFLVLDRAAEACRKTQREKLILKCKTGITAVSLEELTYCEVLGHSLLFHLGNGTVLESKGKLEELEEKLCSQGTFLRVHRSYLVNMACIQSIAARAVTLTGGVHIPIPHGKYNEVKRAYLAYAFEKEQMLL